MYQAGEKVLARELFTIAYQCSEKEPGNPILMLNKALIECIMGGCDPSMFIPAISALGESPSRNLAILTLQVMQRRIDPRYLLTRRFNQIHLPTPELVYLLDRVHTAAGEIEERQIDFEVIINQRVDFPGVAVSVFFTSGLLLGLCEDSTGLSLCVYQPPPFHPQAYTRVGLLHKRPEHSSNMVVVKTPKDRVVVFGVENKCVIYRLGIEIERTGVRDVLSNILRVEADPGSRSVFLLLENKEIWKVEFPSMQYTLFLKPTVSLLQIQANPRYCCQLRMDRTLHVQSIDPPANLDTLVDMI